MRTWTLWYLDIHWCWRKDWCRTYARAAQMHETFAMFEELSGLVSELQSCWAGLSWWWYWDCGYSADILLLSVDLSGVCKGGPWIHLLAIHHPKEAGFVTLFSCFHCAWPELLQSQVEASLPELLLKYQEKLLHGYCLECEYICLYSLVASKRWSDRKSVV